MSSRVVFAWVLWFGLLAMTAINALDPDLWWHLRTGQWIVQNGRVPSTDPFSFTRPGAPWVSQEWLSELIFFELWKHGGPGTLIAFSSIITTAGFLLLYFRCPGKPSWAAAATALGALACAPSWGARPQMFTFTMASLLLWLVERAEHSARLLFWVPPLFLLWLNLHAGFELAPVLLMLYGAGLILEAAVGVAPWNQARPIALRILVTILACLALVPLNPNGARLYSYPLQTLLSPGMRSFILEWFSPDFHRAIYAPFLLVLLLLLLTLAGSHISVRGRILLPLLFTTFAALDAVRHIPIFILLAIPVIMAAAPVSSASMALTPPHPARARFRLFFNALAIVLLAAYAFSRWATLARAQDARESALFPQEAVSFLRNTPQPGRLFVYYDWGGYAIWKLYPQYRVFADGRADLYGDDLLKSIRTTVELGRGWHAVLDRWNVQTILIPPGSALAQALLIDPGWTAPHIDSHAAIFVRVSRPPESQRGYP